MVGQNKLYWESFGWSKFQYHYHCLFLCCGSQTRLLSRLHGAVRFPDQAVGGICGAKAILQVMPKHYRELLKGPSLKVDLHTGGVAEGILTFLFSFSLLVIVFKGPRNLILQAYMLAVTTVGFSWFYLPNLQ